MNLQPLKEIKTGTWIALIIAFYIGTSYGVYRLRHPEQTETQLALNIWDALTWQ